MKIIQLTDMGYCPESSEDLHQHLAQFVNEKKLVLREGEYTLF